MAKSEKNWLETLRNYREIIIIIAAGFPGLIAAVKSFEIWWFGLQYEGRDWDIILGIYIVLAWLFLFCICLIRHFQNKSNRQIDLNRLKELNNLKELKQPQWSPDNLRPWHPIPVLTVGILFLVGGIILADLAWRKRLNDKVVILVAPFEGAESEKYNVAKTIKAGLQKDIPLGDWSRVKVILAAEPKDEKAKRLEPEELAKKYLADMVVSGWYTRAEPNVVVCTKFHIFNLPKPFPAVFRKKEIGCPTLLNFNKIEIENLNLQFCLRDLVGYRSSLILGAGAYASENWELAITYFLRALERADDFGQKNESKEKMLGIERPLEDKVLLNIFVGHCFLNLGYPNEAIRHYSKAIKQGKSLPLIQSQAYASRAIAYRQKNAFEAAAEDLEAAQDYKLPYHTKKGMQGLCELAKELRKRGDEYIECNMAVHAQAELSESVRILTGLCEEALLPELKSEYELELAYSCASLGKMLFKQAPDDAIKHLDSAIKTFEKLNKDEPNLALCCRYLGEARFAKGQTSQLESAIKDHKKAKRVWESIGKDDEAGGELVRIGNIHRKLATQGRSQCEQFEEDVNSAVDNYKKALEKFVAKEYINCLDADSMVPKDGEDGKLVEHAIMKDNAQHLANAMAQFAETYLVRYSSSKSSSDMDNAMRLTRCAAECYGRIVDDTNDKELYDDLAWSLTICGCALNKQEKYKAAKEKLIEAKKKHDKIKSWDEGKKIFAWNLFALAAAQVKSDDLEAADDTFLLACTTLKELTKKPKKDWCACYLPDSLDMILDAKVEYFKKRGIDKYIPAVKKWLEPDDARNAEEALDKIIKKMEENKKGAPSLTAKSSVDVKIANN